MKKQFQIGILAVGLVVCLAGAPAQAQDKISVFAGYSFGSSNNGCVNSCFDPTLHGYAASFTYNFNRHIGLEANFSGHNGDTTLFSQPATSTTNGENFFQRQDMYFYTFGPRITMPVGKFSIYTHFLVGGARYHTGTTDKCILSTGSEGCFTTSTSHATANGFAAKVGGGVDWNHGRWGIQILEVDYVRSELQITETDCVTGCTPFTFPGGSNNVELSTGIKFYFGGKNQ